MRSSAFRVALDFHFSLDLAEEQYLVEDVDPLSLLENAWRYSYMHIKATKVSLEIINSQLKYSVWIQEHNQPLITKLKMKLFGIFAASALAQGKVVKDSKIDNP